MKKALRRTLKISGFVLGAIALLLIVAVLLVVFDQPLVRSIVQKQLGRGPGSSARIGRLEYKLFPLRVTVESLELVREDAFQKMTVSIARLDAAGALGKIVRGTKPALDGIEAGGVSLRLEQKAVSDKPLDVEKMLIQAADTLAWTKRAALTNARLSFSFLTRQAEVEGFDITLTPDPATDVVAYSIGRGDVAVSNKDGALLFASGLSSAGSLGLVSPYVLDATFALTSPRFAAAGLEDPLESASLSLAGRFDRPSQELRITRLVAGLAGLLSVEGTAAARLGHSLFVEAEARVRLESLETVAALLGPRLPAELRAASPHGRAELAGNYALQRTDQGSKDNLAASLTLEAIDLSPVIDGRRLRVRAGGRIDAAGPSRDPRISADIRSTVGAAAISGVTVAGSNVRLVASGSRSAADISLLDARLDGLAFDAAGGGRIAFDTSTLKARGTIDLVRKSGVLSSLDARLDGLAYDAAGGGRIAFDTSALTAKGTVDLARKSGVLSSLEVRLPGLTPLRLSGRFGSARSSASEVRLESRGLEVPTLRALAAPFIPAGFAGWDLGGTLDLSLDARRPAGSNADWGLTGTIALADVMFNDPSFTIAGENLDPVLKLEAASSASKGLSFSGSLDIGRGESLWRSVYVSWSKHPLRLTAAGRYDCASGALDGLAARVLLPEVGSVDVTGSAVLGPAPSFDLSTETRLSLGPAYSLYTQAGASVESRLRLEGALAASLLVRKAGGSLSVGGRVRLADASVESPQSKTFVLGLSADLPLLYESSPARQEGQPPSGTVPLTETGGIRIGEIQNPALSLKSVDIAVRAGVNTLAIEPVSLELFGGRLELGRTTLRLDPATGAFQGVGSLALRDIDVARFPIPSPQFKLTGRIQADFPRLDISPDRIGVSGRGEASLFGGQIVLRDLAVSEPFDPGRSISLNVDLVDLDLKKLTDEVPFGEVTGIVRGEIRDLVITYGQPESFTFRLESVRRKGVPQTFSLKAVDNLTVLSSGQQASGGTGGFWMSFIRGFRYRRLGIVSTLRNDTFTLNGTIRDAAGTEYLVKKPALFGISVVNREPDKSISFKEMVGRLKRVGQSGR